MAFTETKTLHNQDSKIRVNVEALARINISDVEYLLEKIDSVDDSKLKRIFYETAINKLSTVFQLAMKSLKYLEKKDRLKEILKDNSSDSNSGIAAVKSYRDSLFHDGINFIEKDTYYPFGKISGKGFVAIRISKGARFGVKGIYDFSSLENEFVITSEGIFEISDSGEPSERWIQINPISSFTAENLSEIKEVCLRAVGELKVLWHELSEIRKEGDGVNEYSYFNEGGSWELIENKNGIISYKAEAQELHINGVLTLTPTDDFRVDGDRIVYEATTKDS